VGGQFAKTMQLVGQKRVQKETKSRCRHVIKSETIWYSWISIESNPCNFYSFYAIHQPSVHIVVRWNKTRTEIILSMCSLLSSPFELFLFYNTSISIFPSSSSRSTFDYNNTNNNFQASCPNLVPINQLDY